MLILYEEWRRKEERKGLRCFGTNVVLACVFSCHLASKGYWGELLGVGDFYYELGIQIIDVCLSTRALNGGLMELSEVKRRVERMRGVRNPSTTQTQTNNSGSKWANAFSAAAAATSSSQSKENISMEITEDDVLRSVKTLAPLGSGFQVLQIGDKKMVSSVPRELNRDQSVILGLVQVCFPPLPSPDGNPWTQLGCFVAGWLFTSEEHLTTDADSAFLYSSHRKRMDMSTSMLCAKN